MTGPRFLGLTQTAFGVLASWDDGAGNVRLAIVENGRVGGRIGMVLRRVGAADYSDIFPPAPVVADLPEPSAP